MPREYPGKPGELILGNRSNREYAALMYFLDALDRLAPHVPKRFFDELSLKEGVTDEEIRVWFAQFGLEAGRTLISYLIDYVHPEHPYEKEKFEVDVEKPRTRTRLAIALPTDLDSLINRSDQERFGPLLRAAGEPPIYRPFSERRQEYRQRIEEYCDKVEYLAVKARGVKPSGKHHLQRDMDWLVRRVVLKEPVSKIALEYALEREAEGEETGDGENTARAVVRASDRAAKLIGLRIII